MAILSDADRQQGGVYSLADFGIVPSDADVSAAFQAMIDSLPTSCTIWVPPGGYFLANTIDFSRLHCFTLIGVGYRAGSDDGSSILGKVNGDLIRYLPGTGTCLFRGLSLCNGHAAGTTLHLEGINSGSIEQCKLAGNRGLYAPMDIFSLALRSVNFNGSLSEFPAGIGASVRSGGGVTFECCDVVGWHEGLRLSGAGCNVIGGRFEVNRTAIRTGIDTDGTSAALSRSTFLGISMEGCDCAIELNATSGCTFGGISHQGSEGSPAGLSRNGLVVNSCGGLTFDGIDMHGSYSDAAYRVNSATTGITFRNCGGQNFTGKIVWDIPAGIGPVILDNCNANLRPDDVTQAAMLRRGLDCQTLGAVSYLEPHSEGKNFRGKGLAVSPGATSLAVAFTPAIGPGNAALHTATPLTTGGAALAPGTYYYVASVVSARGENPAYGELVVNVVSPNNSVIMDFFNLPAGGWRRRVYRGTVSGVYDGYYEMPLDSSANFTDIGAVFDGFSHTVPAGDATEFDMIEPDANYAVWATPSWNTTVWITGRTTTGFTINFGTAAPWGPPSIG